MTEYADAAGAAAGFAFLEDESGLPSPAAKVARAATGATLAADVPGTRVVGNDGTTW